MAMEQNGEFGIAISSASPGEIGRDRGTASPQLTGQSVQFFARKSGRDLIDRQRERVRFLPDLQVVEILHGAPGFPSARGHRCERRRFRRVSAANRTRRTAGPSRGRRCTCGHACPAAGATPAAATLAPVPRRGRRRQQRRPRCVPPPQRAERRRLAGDAVCFVEQRRPAAQTAPPAWRLVLAASASYRCSSSIHSWTSTDPLR